MNNDKLFKGMLISLGVIVVLSVAIILVVSNLGGKSQLKGADYIKDVTKQHPFGSTATNDLLKQDAVWNKNMVEGNVGTGKHVVVYSDLFCPYCAKEAKAASDPQFKPTYVDTGKIYYETRITDSLAIGDDRPSVNSTKGGEMLYCAADQNKFFDYYHRMLEKIKADYYDKGLGGYHGAPEIPVINDSFFYDGARDAGLDIDKLTKCTNDGIGLKKLRQVTDSAARTNKDSKGKAQGLPAIFIDNTFITAGFSEGGYSDLQKMFANAGVS